MSQKNLSTVQTLLDLAAMLNNGTVLRIAEVLSNKTPVLRTADYRQASNALSDVYGVRKSLASATWRHVGAGVAATATQMGQEEEPVALLEAISKIDVELIDNTPNKARARWNYDKGYLQGMGNDFEDGFWYAAQGTDPDQIDGMATRYDATALTNIISAGGSGSSVMSAWLIDWGEMACSLIHPVASPSAGIKMEDKGVQLVQDSSNLDFFAYVTRFVMRAGIRVQDNRCVQRICNIQNAGATNIFDPDLLVEAYENFPNGTDNVVMYVPKKLKVQINQDALGRSNAYYTVKELYGRPVTHFWDMPIFKADRLLITETALT